MKNEIIIIDKNQGYTSRDVVNKLTHLLNTKKIGHTGTLDPMATGVLVCLTNKYTKLVDLITSLEKEYIATIKLGIETDTLDITGNIIKKDNNYNLNKDKLVEVLNSFQKTYEQEVPIYSAVHVNGKRLYEYAKRDEEVKLPKRLVTIKKIDLIEFKEDLIKFKVVVSKGTYIRSLIKDICASLNVIGTMSELVRTKQGNFKIEDSYKLEDIENNNYKSLNLEDVIELKVKKIDNDNLYKKVINGNNLIDKLTGYVLYKLDNKDIALYYFEEGLCKLKILF